MVKTWSLQWIDASWVRSWRCLPQALQARSYGGLTLHALLHRSEMAAQLFPLLEGLEL